MASSQSNKRVCVFNEELKKEFPFLKKVKVSTVRCSKCNGEFSVAHGGKNDITRHLNSEKHKQALQAASSSHSMTEFFRHVGFGEREKEIATAEALFSYHTIAHNQSFRSMDCTSKIIKTLFEKKFSCGRTKCEAIVKKVLAPQTFRNLITKLGETSFFSLYSDLSNHKDIKLLPTLVRYFDYKEGIKIKILDITSLQGETSDIIKDALLEILHKNNLSRKLIAFSADNANTNFGGLARKGINNVFSKLNASLEQNIMGVGCSAHIIHNAIQTGADLLPIDIENIVIKIYSHFYIYTVRVTILKEFCEEAEIEYNRILGYSKTRWLALMPALERILKMYVPLKSYFLSSEKCPKVIENFFQDEF